ncbi:MAG: DHH family phosphoesterase, partial [Gemmatimonadales bacterium]
MSRVVASMLRSANRDFLGGFRPNLSVVEGDARNLWSARMKGWLGDDDLADADVPRAHPDDRLDEIRKVLMRSTSPGVLVIDDNGRVCGVGTKSNLIRPSPLKLILVDHNELTQAVPGADQVEILEIIDHHRLGNFHTERPIRFINQPLGSTCSVVATLYRQAGIDPEPKIASLMLAGLLSDTLLLKSPTTTDTDRQLLIWLEQCSELDASAFGRQ